MARSFATRPAFFVTTAWLYPWRGHLQGDQHFSSQIRMTVPMARSFAKRQAFTLQILMTVPMARSIEKRTPFLSRVRLDPLRPDRSPPLPNLDRLWYSPIYGTKTQPDLWYQNSARFMDTHVRNLQNPVFLDNVCQFSIRLKKLTHVIKVNRFRRGREGRAGGSGTSTRDTICM